MKQSPVIARSPDSIGTTKQSVLSLRGLDFPISKISPFEKGLALSLWNGGRSRYLSLIGEPSPSQRSEGLSQRLCWGITVTLLKTLNFLPQWVQTTMRITKLFFMLFPKSNSQPFHFLSFLRSLSRTRCGSGNPVFLIGKDCPRHVFVICIGNGLLDIIRIGEVSF